MDKRTIGAMSLVAAVTVVSCGGSGSGVTTAGFSDQLAGLCRTINRGIGNLDAATTLDDVRSNASDASALFEDGLNEMKQLTVPTSDEQFASDVRDLIASFEDQLDTLDAVAKAARQNDQDTVDARIAKLRDQAADGNDLADGLGISRCQLDPVFVAAPATTEPPVTEPPVTEPIVPLTLPIATTPAATVPFGTSFVPTSNKTVQSSAVLVPLGDYTFTDVPDDAARGFETVLDLAPSIDALSGIIVGVDVIDSSGELMGRIFLFEADGGPLPAGSFEEVTPFITSDTLTTPKTVGSVDGVTWTDPDGTVNFLVSGDADIVWSFAPTEAQLDAALQAWSESL